VRDFQVTVTRESGYWVGVVQGLRGGATEAQNLELLRTEMIDLISGLTDLDPDNITVNLAIKPDQA
jgi:hypothetical protein